MTDYTETVSNETDPVEYDYFSDTTSPETGGEVIINNPVSVHIYNDGMDEASDPEDETEEIIYLDEVEVQEPVRVLSVTADSRDSRAALSSESLKNLWTLSIGGNEYKILFPNNAELDVLDGILINRSGSNITGAVIDNSLSDSSYFTYTFTVLPFTSSNTQNSVYRYHARSYLTRYYQSTSVTSLATDVSYVNAEVVYRPPGWTFKASEITIICCLLAIIVINFIGGLIRR